MGRITKFSQIPAQLKYPAYCKGVLSQMHSDIITAVIHRQNFRIKELKDIVRLINTLSYKALQKDSITWDKANPLDCSDLLDDSDVRDTLESYSMYVAFPDINWESDNIVKVAMIEALTPATASATVTPEVKPVVESKPAASKPAASKPVYIQPTPKEALYIKPPVIPRFSISSIYASTTYDNNVYCIYKSLPVVPTCQNEISITTDVNLMTSRDLMQLYPNHFIRTRANAAYEYIHELELLPDLGLILPIEGYSREELIDNIIKYPHLYKLMKWVDGQIVSFYTTIEIDGELKRTAEVWKTLPESSVIPYNSDLVKEYVVRRYLLERDIKHIEHKYQMFGTLDPFLTLFTTPEDYVKYGYTDVEDLAKQCVKARVSYKESRNPVLRRLKDA